MFIVSSIQDDLSTLSIATNIKVNLSHVYTSAGITLPNKVSHMDLFLHHAYESTIEIDRKVWEANKELNEDELIVRVDAIEVLLSKVYTGKHKDALLEVNF